MAIRSLVLNATRDQDLLNYVKEVLFAMLGHEVIEKIELKDTFSETVLIAN